MFMRNLIVFLRHSGHNQKIFICLLDFGNLVFLSFHRHENAAIDRSNEMPTLTMGMDCVRE